MAHIFNRDVKNQRAGGETTPLSSEKTNKLTNKKSHLKNSRGKKTDKQTNKQATKITFGPFYLLHKMVT